MNQNNGPIEGGIGHENPSGSSVRGFVFFMGKKECCFSFIDLALPSRAAKQKGAKSLTVTYAI